MALAYLEVVGVVSGGYLDRAASEVLFDVIVRDYRYLSSDKGQDKSLADHIGISFVLGIDRDRGIAQYSLGTGRSNDYLSASVSERISYVPQVRILFGIFDFGVGKRRLAGRTPVDDPVAAVYKPFVVKVDEHLFDCLGALLVHSERHTRPVAGRTEESRLLLYPVAVLFFPCPRALQKSLSADVLFRESFLFLHQVDYLDLCRDRSVIDAWKPQRAISAHAFETGDHVLHRMVERMPQVQLSRNVRRRHHDSKRLFLLIYFRLEIAFLLPLLVESAFKL